MTKKHSNKKDFYKKLSSLFIVVGFFILASYYTQQNVDLIREFISKGGIVSVLIYIIATIVAIIAAPLTSIPLIPLVVQVWGVLLTSIFSIIGWIIGSIGAFWIARNFGASVVSKIESLEQLRVIADRIPEKRLFWYLLFLRITIPVDILSYALGLFTNISWKMFIVTTFIGIIPITFLLSYLGLLPAKTQLVFTAVGVLMIVIFFLFHSRRPPSN